MPFNARPCLTNCLCSPHGPLLPGHTVGDRRIRNPDQTGRNTEILARQGRTPACGGNHAAELVFLQGSPVTTEWKIVPNEGDTKVAGRMMRLVAFPPVTLAVTLGVPCEQRRQRRGIRPRPVRPGPRHGRFPAAQIRLASRRPRPQRTTPTAPGRRILGQPSTRGRVPRASARRSQRLLRQARATNSERGPSRSAASHL